MRINKHYWRALGLGITLIIGTTQLIANDYLSLWVNDVKIETDAPPIMGEGVTLVPISFIAQKLGATVEWKSPQVIITQGSKEVRCSLYESEAFINDKSYVLEVPPRLLEGRVLIPLRFVTQALGAKVDYVVEKGEIRITQDEVEEEQTANVEQEYSVFFDETSNNFVYSIQGFDLLYHQPTNQWSKLEKGDSFISDEGDGKFPSVWEKGRIDLNAKKLFIQDTYDETPNGKWRYLNKRKWNSTTHRQDVGFIQNLETGEVREILKSNGTVLTYVLPDNTFYIEMKPVREEGVDGISEEEMDYYGSDEVFIYNPKTNEMKLVGIGAHSYYVREQQVIAYKRVDSGYFKHYLYNVQTKAIKEITPEQYAMYEELCYAGLGREKEMDTSPELLAQEEIAKLPIQTVQEVPYYVADVHVKGKVIPLEFAYMSEGEGYIPVKNIMAATGLQMVTQADGKKVAVVGGKGATVNHSNSATFDERLYISQAVLEELGLEVKVKFNTPKP